MTVIIFILVLGVLVLVHEFGHFIVAKKSGCFVEEFGIGFPPRLFSIKRGETRYAINLLPLGGYVKIKGEDGTEPEHPRSFTHKSFLIKSFIVTAGVFMNILLGYVLLTSVLLIGTRTSLEAGQNLSHAIISNRSVEVVEVLDQSPAQQAGLQAGDIITSVNGQAVAEVNQLVSTLQTDQTVTVGYERNHEQVTTDITPTLLKETNQQGIGVGLIPTGVVRYPWYLAPVVGVERTGQILWLIVQGFATLIGQLVSGHGVQTQIAGPIGIAVLTGEVAREGFVQLIQFTALLSLNLAIINILPIPALDGGRLLFLVIEKVRRRKMRVGLEQWIHIIGFAALMILIVLITAKDISTYGGQIWQSIQHFFA